MEDDDNISNLSKRFDDDEDQNRIVQQLLRTKISSKKKKLFWYDIRNFPDSLLIEILVKLPLKSIFMFVSVCKHWQSLISDPSFPRFYHSILNSNSNAAALPFRFLYRYSHQFRVLDISNGLILCCSKSPTPFDYYICDPLTRHWITIPRRGPRISHSGFRVGLITRVNEDHMLTGYTVVRFEHLESQSNHLNIEIFSSETDEWINYNLPCSIPIQLRELAADGPIHCYGALHWTVCHHDEDLTHAMVAFDPYKDPKSVRLIPLPEDRDLASEHDFDGAYQLCGESQGTLRYLEVADDPAQLYLLTMWAMKDYEKGEWCREFKVRHSDIQTSDLKLSNWLLDGWFEPLSFHPLNPNVVYLTCMHMEPGCLVSYDVLNRRLDVACKRVEPGQYISSVIPFVLPRWPVLVSNASVNSKIKGIKCRK